MSLFDRIRERISPTMPDVKTKRKRVSEPVPADEEGVTPDYSRELEIISVRRVPPKEEEADDAR